MREIKFRAWDKRSKKMWIPDNILHGPFGIYEIDVTIVGDECEIMQYIGLKDKEGKEIYEWDIVRITNPDGTYQVSVVKEKGIIEGDFGDYNTWLIDWAKDADYLFEIIGNIHENKELLTN